MLDKHFLSLLVFIFSSILSFHLNAQSIQWQKSLGGSLLDRARSIQQTTDGGYIVTGESYSSDGDLIDNYGNQDFWVVKLDDEGNISWQKNFGGSGSDVPSTIYQTTDGGYIVAGHTGSNDGDVTGNNGGLDCWVAKLDEFGNIEWQESYGGSNSDHINAIQQTTDGGYIFAGVSLSSDGDMTVNYGGSDCWVVKLDDVGNIEWQKSYGGSNVDQPYSMQQTMEGGYIVAGRSRSTDGDVTNNLGGYDYWVIKLNNVGNIEWQKSLGGSGWDWAYSIQQTTDGGYIVAGESNSNNTDVTENHGGYDCWIVKLDNVGNIEWQKSLGGSDDERARSIKQTCDGGYMMAGRSQSTDGDVMSNQGDYDFWVVKLDETGNIVWQESYGGLDSDIAFSVQQITDGDYVVAGQSNSSDGDVTGNHGNLDMWVVKLRDLTTSLAEVSLLSTHVTLTPNPMGERALLHISDLNSDKDTYTLVIYDIKARQLMEKKVHTGSTRLNTSEIPIGAHFYLLLQENTVVNRGKVIVNR